MDKKFSRIQLISVILLFALCLVSILNIAEASITISGLQNKLFSSNNKDSLPFDLMLTFKLVFGIIGTILPLVLVFIISKDKISASKGFLINLTYKFAELAILLGFQIWRYSSTLGNSHYTEDMALIKKRGIMENYGSFLVIFIVLFIIGLITLLIKTIKEETLNKIIVIISAIAIGIVFYWLIFAAMNLDSELYYLKKYTYSNKNLKELYINLSSLVILDATLIGTAIGFSLPVNKK